MGRRPSEGFVSHVCCPGRSERPRDRRTPFGEVGQTPSSHESEIPLAVTGASVDDEGAAIGAVAHDSCPTEVAVAFPIATTESSSASAGKRGFLVEARSSRCAPTTCLLPSPQPFRAPPDIITTHVPLHLSVIRIPVLDIPDVGTNRAPRASHLLELLPSTAGGIRSCPCLFSSPCAESSGLFLRRSPSSQSGQTRDVVTRLTSESQDRGQGRCRRGSASGEHEVNIRARIPQGYECKLQAMVSPRCRCDNSKTCIHPRAPVE